jgi:hypothetical protein
VRKTQAGQGRGTLFDVSDKRGDPLRKAGSYACCFVAATAVLFVRFKEHGDRPDAWSREIVCPIRTLD